MGCISSTNKPLFALKRDDIFSVSVVRVQSNQPLALRRHGYLDITPNELIFIASEQDSISWSLQHLRRYGLTGNVFSFEAGRRCPIGAGIYTFRCSNADEFYAKFQRCINAMAMAGDRNNSLIHTQTFDRLDSYQSIANHYLEPTSALLSTSNEATGVTDSFNRDFNLDSSDSVRNSSLPGEILHFPISTPSYSNVSPITQASLNIYMEQPIRSNSGHNSNMCSNKKRDSTNTKHKNVVNPLLKSSSLDLPPDEYAPNLNASVFDGQKLYENIDSRLIKNTNSFKKISDKTERFYANLDFLPRDGDHIKQDKSIQMDFGMDRQSLKATNVPIVNYIILDLDQSHSPSPISPKKCYDSDHSLSGSGRNSASFEKDELSFIGTPLSCGASTMPKGSTISNDSLKILSNRIESSGSYTRIDFLKTFALMKSAANCIDFDIENEQESRITRHSKFVRKAYSISE